MTYTNFHIPRLGGLQIIPLFPLFTYICTDMKKSNSRDTHTIMQLAYLDWEEMAVAELLFYLNTGNIT